MSTRRNRFDVHYVFRIFFDVSEVSPQEPNSQMHGEVLEELKSRMDEGREHCVTFGCPIHVCGEDIGLLRTNEMCICCRVDLKKLWAVISSISPILSPKAGAIFTVDPGIGDIYFYDDAKQMIAKRRIVGGEVTIIAENGWYILV
ncbi:hypothetical protein KIN20_035934 [Parelaphostrongylus tenuis]|uniref:Uncharacterized protein n=1 Tax=Parelaphostrongylus tenuis TaxID=148309 RepID=A0AAD5RCI6_PARTN|nr:hypothetical protein KIN20_035934 [Parelaphostrongylus tenuis]